MRQGFQPLAESRNRGQTNEPVDKPSHPQTNEPSPILQASRTTTETKETGFFAIFTRCIHILEKNPVSGL